MLMITILIFFKGFLFHFKNYIMLLSLGNILFLAVIAQARGERKREKGWYLEILAENGISCGLKLSTPSLPSLLYLLFF